VVVCVVEPIVEEMMLSPFSTYIYSGE